MWKFAIIFIIFQLTLTVNSDPKCSEWTIEIGKMQKCCKLPIPVDTKILDSVYKQNLTICATHEKIAELLNFNNGDKTAQKNQVMKSINDSEWQTIFVKNIDFCTDLVPKLVPPFAKKANVTETGCGVKWILTANCWFATAFSECPAKFYTDSSDCQKLTKTIKECKQNSADIVKAFETQ